MTDRRYWEGGDWEVGDPVACLFWFAIALLILWVSYSEIYKMPNDEIIWLDGEPKLVEAKSFLDGVWFHKDSVTIGYDHFIIIKKAGLAATRTQ